VHLKEYVLVCCELQCLVLSSSRNSVVVCLLYLTTQSSASADSWPSTEEADDEFECECISCARHGQYLAGN